MLIDTTSGGKQIRLDQSGADHLYFIRRKDKKTLDVTDSFATGVAAEFSRLVDLASATKDFNGNLDLSLSKDKSGTTPLNVMPDTDMDKILQWCHNQLDQDEVDYDIAHGALFDIRYVNSVTGKWVLLEGCFVSKMPNNQVNHSNNSASPLAYTITGAELSYSPITEQEAGLA